MSFEIRTIGHSTRTAEDFLQLLQEHRITALADVRRHPGSRRHPAYSAATLASFLDANGIEYHHFPELGGRRKPLPDSPNSGWRNDAFRGYADHMLTDEFAGGVARLIALPGLAAVMCAEAVPWRCHRMLLSDELTRRGMMVRHILSAAAAEPHRMTSFARDTGTHLVYPASDQQQLPLT